MEERHGIQGPAEGTRERKGAAVIGWREELKGVTMP